MSPSLIIDDEVAAQQPVKSKSASPPSPASSTGSKTFGNMNTSMVESKFLDHPGDLGVVAVGFSGGQVGFPGSGSRYG
jgi:hypothetical protein